MRGIFLSPNRSFFDEDIIFKGGVFVFIFKQFFYFVIHGAFM